MSHAFNDWNVMPEHSYRISEALKARGVPVQIYYHQGGHGGPPPLERMNRWFTRYLYDVDNGVERRPEAPGSSARVPMTPKNQPRILDYPHPRSRSRCTVYLQAGEVQGGTMNGVGTDFRSRPRLWQPGHTRVSIDNVSFDWQGAAHASAEWTSVEPPALRHARAGGRMCIFPARPALTIRVAANAKRRCQPVGLGGVVCRGRKSRRTQQRAASSRAAGRIPQNQGVDDARANATRPRRIL